MRVGKARGRPVGGNVLLLLQWLLSAVTCRVEAQRRGDEGEVIVPIRLAWPRRDGLMSCEAGRQQLLLSSTPPAALREPAWPAGTGRGGPDSIITAAVPAGLVAVHSGRSLMVRLVHSIQNGSPTLQGPQHWFPK